MAQLPQNIRELETALASLQAKGVSAEDREKFVKAWKLKMAQQGVNTEKLYTDYAKQKQAEAVQAQMPKESLPTLADIGEEQKQPEQPKKGIVERYGEKVGEAVESYKEGDAGLLKTGGRIAASTLGAAAQGIGKVAEKGIELTGEAASAVLPDIIERPLVGAAKATGRAVGSAGAVLIEKLFNPSGELKTPEEAKAAIAQFSTDAADAYGEWAKAHPEAAQDVRAVGDVANFMATVPAFGIASGAAKQAGKGVAKGAMRAGYIAEKSIVPIRGATGEAIRGTSEALEASAKGAIRKQAEEIALPRLEELTQKTRTGVARRIEEGAFGSRSIVPDANDSRAIDEIARMIEEKKISPRDTTVKQVSAIDNEIGKMSNDLENGLKNSPSGEITQEIYQNSLDDIASSLSKKITITGDAEKLANKMIKIAKQQIAGIENPNALDILRARKGYDMAITAEKGKAILSQDMETAFKVANDAIRSRLNDMAESLAPTQEIKDVLARQRALYRALDTAETRFAKESTSTILRTMQKIPLVKNLPRSEIVEALGILGFGGAAIAGMPIASAIALALGTVLAAQTAGRLIMSPQMKQALAKILKEIGAKVSGEDGKAAYEELKKQVANSLQVVKSTKGSAMIADESGNTFPAA